MSRELSAGARCRREDAREDMQSNERCKKKDANENDTGGLRPLPLLFPTASWSSYHPSDLDSSYEEGSSKALHSSIYSHSENSAYEDGSEGDNTGASSRLSAILSLSRCGDHDTGHSPEGNSPHPTQRRRLTVGSFKPWKPWNIGYSRRSRTPERVNALLYLALADPALSASALLATEEQTQRSLNDSCEKERERDSDLLSLSTLLGLACIIVFVAFVLGLGVGCALVRTRPSRGKAVLAVLPLTTRVANTGWEKEDGSGPWVDNAGTTPTRENLGTAGVALKQRELTASAPVLTLLIHDTSSQTTKPLAVLKGTFKLLLPLHNAGFFGGTESGVTVLEYIPAPHAGKRAEDLCFTARSPLAEAGHPLTPTPAEFPTLSTIPQPHEEMLANKNADSVDADVQTISSEDEHRPGVPSFPKLAARPGAPGIIGPAFELLPTMLDSNFNSVLEPGYPTMDQAQHEAGPLLSESATKLLIRGSFLPLQGEEILKGDNFLNLQLHTRQQKNKDSEADALHASPRVDSVPKSLSELSFDVSDRKEQPSAAFAAAKEGEKKLLSRFLEGLRDSRLVRQLRKEDSDGRATEMTGNGLHASAGGLLDESTGEQISPHRNTTSPNSGEVAEVSRERQKHTAPTRSQSPYILAVSFHPMSDAQGSGFRAKELWVRVHHEVTSQQMYEDLLQDCRLGRIYVQLSTALAYYNLFFWSDVEQHSFLPLAIGCQLKYEVQPLLQNSVNSM
ncbi:hypothetical protein, conserved [Eimeria praecox]|uniref:Transmembrane protein n=1 Tax=Eimeria praecox TaxID=51316 RepID=U6GW55_9EIME|nr:hypothetical protein, conserved [Eimeria praecox]